MRKETDLAKVKQTARMFLASDIQLTDHSPRGREPPLHQQWDRWIPGRGWGDRLWQPHRETR